MLGKLLLLTGAALWMATTPGNTAKTRATEDRLNTAMPRIPWPQPYDGPASNSSYGPANWSYPPGNSSYTSGNSSYSVSTGWNGAGAADNGGVTSGQIGGASAHYHAMAHGHYYGNNAADFNNLQYTVSTLVDAYNNHVNDHGNLVVAVQNLRQDHSNLLDCVTALRAAHSSLLDTHNLLMTRLYNSNILH